MVGGEQSLKMSAPYVSRFGGDCVFKILLNPNRDSYRADILRECSPPTTCHMSCAMCHMSRVRCQVSGVTCHVSGVTCRASKSCRRADARLRKIVEHLRKICIFKRKTGKTGTFFMILAQFDKTV